MSSEADRSELKSVIFMALRRRKLRMTVGGSPIDYHIESGQPGQ